MPSSDGVLDVLGSVSFGERKMPPEIFDPVSAQLLTTHAINGAQRQADDSAFVAAQSRLGYLESKEKIGTREAQAMQEVRTSAQAREILQARAASDQPKA